MSEFEMGVMAGWAAGVATARDVSEVRPIKFLAGFSLRDLQSKWRTFDGRSPEKFIEDGVLK